jgi:hypothetical protein
MGPVTIWRSWSPSQPWSAAHGLLVTDPHERCLKESPCSPAHVGFYHFDMCHTLLLSQIWNFWIGSLEFINEICADRPRSQT